MFRANTSDALEDMDNSVFLTKEFIPLLRHEEVNLFKLKNCNKSLKTETK
jgi:hypothetical protein